MANKERTKVFISYSHRDATWLERLRVHLRPLERESDIDIWDDTKILPGYKWRQEIENAIATARVAVLLVSADFLASDFIATNELPPLLEAAEMEGAVILPIIVSPSRFLKTNLAQFQSVNNPAFPLVKLSKGEQEEIFVDLTERVEAALEAIPHIVHKGAVGNVGQTNQVSQELEMVPNSNYDFLKDVSLIVYYQDIEYEKAKQVWSFLIARGMHADTFEYGIGSAGPKTIVYYPSYKNVAIWLKEKTEMFKNFKLEITDPRDRFQGVILNLW